MPSSFFPGRLLGSYLLTLSTLGSVLVSAHAPTVAAADSPNAATPMASEEVTRGSIIEDIIYANVGGEDLKLNLILPENVDAPTACVVVIHGGAWRMGDKNAHHGELQALARDGYAAASVAYRFCPEHRFPAQVHDVKRAIKFLRSKADEYQIDQDRFGALGYSAGGHLAMMLGTSDPRDGLEPVDGDHAISSKVQAVVSFFGPTDLTQKNIPVQSSPLLLDFIGGDQAEQADVYRLASPISHLDEKDAPILLFQGTKDPLVPFEQAVLMGQKMSSVGVDGRVELLIGEGHGWGAPQREHTTAQTRQFFAHWLK